MSDFVSIYYLKAIQYMVTLDTDGYFQVTKINK